MSLVPLSLAAHPGLTDSQGCHTDDRGGDYHCHSEEEISSFGSKDEDKTDEESKEENETSNERIHTYEQDSNRDGSRTTTRDRHRGDLNEETVSNSNQSNVLLRLAGGLGHASLGVDNSNGGSFEGGGRSLNYEAALGFNLSQWFILHGSLFGWSVSEPRLTIPLDNGVGVYGEPEDSSMNLLAYGAGATLYMGEDNDGFLSFSLGLPELGVEVGSSNNNNNNSDSDNSGNGLDPSDGIALNAMFGLEQKVSSTTGIGLYGQFGYYSLSSKSSDSDLTGTNIGFGAFIAF